MPTVRQRDLAAGALVLLIPTFATIYSSIVGQWPLAARHVLFGVWIVSACLIVYDQVLRNERSDRSLGALDRLTSEKAKRVKHLADQAREASLRALLTPDLWFPRKWDWTVYSFDEHLGVLAPIWPSDMGAERAQLISFAPGNGATGQAWLDEETIVRVGQEVHDGTHGLTAAQQHHFAHRRSVVATPIWADDEKIGVLAGTCADEDRAFESEQLRSHVRQTATVLGTVLWSLGGSRVSPRLP